MRKFFIHKVARDLNLVFPSSYATAATILNMHSAAGGETLARDKMKWTAVAFVAAMALRVASIFLPNILWVSMTCVIPALLERSLTCFCQGWHVFTWIAQARISTGITKFAIAAESWGWMLEWSPAMIGSGFLVEFGVSCSFFAGAIFAWYAEHFAAIRDDKNANLFCCRGLLGPYLVFAELAFGEPSNNTEAALSGLVSYTTMSSTFSTAEYPSPRYWLLWPGVACTLAVAFSGTVALNCALRATARVTNSDSRTFVPIQNDLGTSHYCNKGAAAVNSPQIWRPLVPVCGCRPRP